MRQNPWKLTNAFHGKDLYSLLVKALLARPLPVSLFCLSKKKVAERFRPATFAEGLFGRVSRTA